MIFILLIRDNLYVNYLSYTHIIFLLYFSIDLTPVSLSTFPYKSIVVL